LLSLVFGDDLPVEVGMHLEPLDGENVFVIHDLLSPQECAALIARSEALGYEAAAVGGELVPQLRNNGRAFLEDAVLAAELWRRAAPFVPARLDGAEAVGLHERFRFYRYEAAEQFGIHMDGAVRRGEAEESRLTFMVYLSCVEEGGETNFYRGGGVLEFAVRPSPGKALAFDHRRLHEGAAVRKGRKYVLRTDVMYQLNEKAEPSQPSGCRGAVPAAARSTGALPAEAG
jgi:predicted 2-oxoglutarate/Fe(II)-dependent dioxygenase YbiX